MLEEKNLKSTACKIETNLVQEEKIVYYQVLQYRIISYDFLNLVEGSLIGKCWFRFIL